MHLENYKRFGNDGVYHAEEVVRKRNWEVNQILEAYVLVSGTWI